MATAVQMPKQGNTVVECLLIEWKVKEGDQVREGDVLCAIETDKASFEVPSTAAGVVLKLLAQPNDLVPVLADIAIVGSPGEKVDAVPSRAPSAPASEKEKPTASAAEPLPPAAPLSGPAGPAVSPRGRKLAAKLGVEPAGLAGSGPNGRITSRDVQAAVDSGRRVKASPLAREIMAETGRPLAQGSGVGGLGLARDMPQPGAVSRPAADLAEGAPELLPYKGIRKLIGDRMLQSLQEHAQLTLNASADASGLLALRKAFKENAETSGLPNISLNDMICWAAARTLPAFPEVNAIFDRAAGVVSRRRRVNLAVAVDTPRGLMVPVIADAHRLSLADLSRNLAKLAGDCRQGSINPDFLAGGTFTVSNLGAMGVESFTPILNAPQAAILGVCAIRETPVPGVNGSPSFQPRLGLSLTIDHQAVDGAPAARFLQALVRAIEGVQTVLVLAGAAKA